MFVIQRYAQPSSPTQLGSLRQDAQHPCSLQTPWALSGVSSIPYIKHRDVCVGDQQEWALWHIHTQRKSQPEGCPGALGSPTTHTHLCTPGSPGYICLRFLQAFFRPLLCLSSSPSLITGVLEGASHLRDNLLSYTSPRISVPLGLGLVPSLYVKGWSGHHCSGQGQST